MTDKITVLHYIDTEGHVRYAVSADSLPNLAKALGVSEDRLEVKPDENEKLIREQQRQELHKRANTPEAIRKRIGDDDLSDW
jgi:hypothetical protein